VLRALLPLGRAIPLAAARRASLQWGESWGWRSYWVGPRSGRRYGGPYR
jgi:hypothetical protein